MAERHGGSIVRLYIDETGTVMVGMMKPAPQDPLGTSLFTFELSRETLGDFLEIHLQLLQTALVHSLPTVITEVERKITHVEINRFLR